MLLARYAKLRLGLVACILSGMLIAESVKDTKGLLTDDQLVNHDASLPAVCKVGNLASYG